MYRFTFMSGKWIGTEIGDDAADAVNDLMDDAEVFLDEGYPVMFVPDLDVLDDANIKYELA